jgi:acetyl-CoA carboxylase carboxyl transferase subunit alpha
VCTVIGEGGSGGALAIAVGDTVLMLQYATYSVISPEGCASILWKSAEQAPLAAEALGITAARLKTLGVIDKVVNEPLGGAHRDHAAMAQNLKKALQDALRQLSGQSTDALVEARFERLMAYGKFKEVQVK